MVVELLGLDCKTQGHPGEVTVYFYPWVAEVMPVTRHPGRRSQMPIGITITLQAEP